MFEKVTGFFGKLWQKASDAARKRFARRKSKRLGRNINTEEVSNAKSEVPKEVFNEEESNESEQEFEEDEFEEQQQQKQKE